MQIREFICTAYVLRVIDGDTLEIDCDLGMHIRRTETVRLYGINAPETRGVVDKEPGRASKAFLETALLAKTVLVKTYKDKEKFGRLLAEIFLPIEGTPRVFSDESIGAVMIAKNLAVPYFGGKRD